MVLASFSITSLKAIGRIRQASVIPELPDLGINHILRSVKTSRFSAHFISRSTTSFKISFNSSVPCLKSSIATPDGPGAFPFSMRSRPPSNSVALVIFLILDHSTANNVCNPVSICFGSWR
eukprot:Lithocolla_globosa_v1_NODE_61_length_7363_cov_12.683498.p6 type:complete len:121 gc:universal NODE_61_length_7363_cov_12.683498:2995-2633(-)